MKCLTACQADMELILVGQERKINPRGMIIFVIGLLLRQGFENFALPHRAPEYFSLWAR